MELSVIIPVYKTEEYLRECVSSILAQANQDVEIILVDDGSPDDCPKICDELVQEDSKIIVIHKINGGLSSARNEGLRVAQGRYITFVDSDDRVCSGCIPVILKWIKDATADICFLRSEKLFPDGTIVDSGERILTESLRMCTREVAIKHLSTRPKYPGSAWAKLYRKDFLIKNELHFPYDRRYSEDLGFVRDCIMCAENFDALDIPYYQYRQNRQGSITNQVSTKNFYDLLLFVTESVAQLSVNKNAYDTIERLIMSFVAYEYSILLYLYNLIPKEDKRIGLSKLKEYKWVLRFAGNSKSKLTFLICTLFGVRFTAFFMKQYRKVVEK